MIFLDSFGNHLVALAASVRSITACVPTIWEDGVTSGGSPKSLRTLGISSRTSWYLSSLSCFFQLANQVGKHTARYLIHAES